MRRWWRAILLFLVVYLLALLVTLPASLALQWAEPVLNRLPQRPVLSGVSGTIWQGQATRLDLRGITLGSVKWDISVWRLLLGRIDSKLELSRDDGYLTTHLVWPLFANEWRLESLEGQLPAPFINKVVPNLPAAVTGMLSLRLERAAFTTRQLRELEGRVVWNNAALASPFRLALGDIALQLTTEQEVIKGHLHDGGGPLQLDVQINLNPDRSYTLTGKAQARPGADASLATSLSLLGQADAQGNVPFQLRGAL